MKKVVKSDAEWKELLTPMQYAVTRRAATEPPGSGEYATSGIGHLHLRLLWHAAVRVGHEFDSACGWPSYFKALDPANVREDSRTPVTV